MRVHGFFRSSASWRVRIALALKGIAHEAVPRNFRKDEQRSPDFLALNPQGLVPAVEVEGAVLTQSMAIIEYLDETHPNPPLLPADPIGRAQVRAMAQAIACDLHPLNNLRVMNHLRGSLGQGDDGVAAWYRHWCMVGLEPVEALARRHSADGRHSFGDTVTLADVLLVPQLANARRFDLDLTPYPTLTGIEAHLFTLPAFAETRPEKQPDAV